MSASESELLEPTWCVAQTATVERMEEILLRYCAHYPIANMVLGEVIADLRNMLTTEHREPAARAEPHMIPVPIGRLRAAIGLLEFYSTGQSDFASHCAEVAADLLKLLPAAPGKEG
jgi:hypothetical protein